MSDPKTTVCHFTVTGEFLTNFARELVEEGSWGSNKYLDNPTNFRYCLPIAITTNYTEVH